MRGMTALLSAAALACAACSQKQEEASTPTANGPVETHPAPATPPATLTDVNLVASEMGGGVESLSNGNDQPGYLGWRLIDGALEPSWIAPEIWGVWRDMEWVKYPVEAVFSFFDRQSALVGAVTIVVPEESAAWMAHATLAAPKDVEIWTSMDGPNGKFTKAATATLDPAPGEKKITFPAVEARFVKLRVLSGASPQEHYPQQLEMAEVRVLESARTGYTALFERAPEAKRWKGSPREAAQRGLDWLEAASLQWTNDNNCFGCHVQSQALMGQAVAFRQGYRVNLGTVRELEALLRRQQTPEGGWPHSATSPSASAFGAMGLARALELREGPVDAKMTAAVSNLLSLQAADGSLDVDVTEPPIIQGQFMTTANALVALEWAASHLKDPKYPQAAARALGWIASHDPDTTQDHVFKIIALMDYGTPDQRRIAWSTVEALAARQQKDGGWKEVAAMDGSNAFATGQALYAFKRAGVSVGGEMFRRGVDYLLKSQVNDGTQSRGSWKVVHSQSHRPSDIAPTMWAVIGLAGSYGTDPKGALHVTKEQGEKAMPPNLEIVLDVSGSMNTKLGDSTRWQIALATLREVVSTLPDDLNVGLRVYGHRYSSKSAETCQDTELLVPIAKLDREKILSAAESLKPRGETPLVRSVLKTVGDLKAAGGGSVILITDGEESCQGNAKSAAKDMARSGVNLTLNIVGFTLTGQKVEAELGSFARATGGQYYGAQNGAQLSRAIRMAAAQRLPYDILDGSGKVVASGETSGFSRELPPGEYRIRIDALGQKLEDSVTIVADQTTAIGIGVDGDRFVIQRQGDTHE